MKIPDHVFRGYDLRGIAGDELTKENVKELGKAYATWLIQRNIPDCVVGYDCRTSGPDLRDALVEGLTQSGINVIDIGMTLTQIAYFSQYLFRTRGMVMITASHNPMEYNGFKMGTGYSETMLTEDVVNFKNLYKSGKFESLSTKGSYKKEDVKQIYINDVIRHTGKVQNFKVVVDSCAATTGVYLPDLLRQAGCEVIEQNTDPDGNFPVGTPDPTEKEVLERLAKRVVEEKADLGFAYDADGDRMGVVDEKGNLVWNDTLCAIYAKDILSRLPGAPIVFNTLCSKQVSETVEAAGGKPVIWMTGHSFIKEKVQREQAPFGGELSGHFYFTDNFYGHDDGAVASLRLLKYLEDNKISLKSAIEQLPQYISSPEIKVGCPDKIKFDVVSNELGGKIKELYPDASYVEIDGVRMDTDQEMMIIRASQNGPYLTVKFEGKNQKDYDRLKHQIKDILESNKNIDFSYGVNVESLN